MPPCDGDDELQSEPELTLPCDPSLPPCDGVDDDDDEESQLDDPLETEPCDPSLPPCDGVEDDDEDDDDDPHGRVDAATLMCFMISMEYNWLFGSLT